jgi:hypothetical protein
MTPARRDLPRPYSHELCRLISLRRTYLPFFLVTMAAIFGMPVPLLTASGFRMTVLIVNAVVWIMSLHALQADIRAERAKQPQEVDMEGS